MGCDHIELKDVQIKEIEIAFIQGQSVEPHTISFKETLLDTNRKNEGNDEGRDVLVNMDKSDVKANTEGKIPFINFSNSVRKVVENFIKIWWQHIFSVEGLDTKD